VEQEVLVVAALVVRAQLLKQLLEQPTSALVAAVNKAALLILEAKAAQASFLRKREEIS
jgi:uncharacterized protein YcsI (UPF0317 family)